MELVIAVGVMFILVGAVVAVGNGNARAYQTGATAAQLEAQVAIAMDRMVADLRMAGRDSLNPDPTPGLGASSLDYLAAVDHTAGETTWTPLRRLALERDPAELDDGLDNNGNGLVDEGRVVLTEDVGGPGERSFVIVRWVSELHQGELANGADDNGNGVVDEPGFFLERVGETLVVRLSLQRNDAQGLPLGRSGQTAIRVRN